MSKSNKFVILNDEWKVEIDSFNTHIPYRYRKVKSKDPPEAQMKWVSLHKYYPNMVQAIRSIINEELRSTGQSSDFEEYIRQY